MKAVFTARKSLVKALRPQDFMEIVKLSGHMDTDTTSKCPVVDGHPLYLKIYMSVSVRGRGGGLGLPLPLTRTLTNGSRAKEQKGKSKNETPVF